MKPSWAGCEDLTGGIAQRLAELRARIGEAAASVGRAADEIRLLAVSKTFPGEAIIEALAAGQVDFGENYVQEARAKVAEIKGPTWHLIGPLQSNKINQALQLFDYIHSVDSIELLHAIDKRAQVSGKRPKLMLQVCLGEEETKHGVAPGELLDQLDALRDTPPLGVDLVGLMSIPPPVADAEENRPHFRRLRQLMDEIRTRQFPFFQDQQLSMGMSDDFPVAIQEGATWVRVGRALFGQRNYSV
jgi:pyridoxal phosphate enzyme (YggS family)